MAVVIVEVVVVGVERAVVAHRLAAHVEAVALVVVHGGHVQRGVLVGARLRLAVHLGLSASQVDAHALLRCVLRSFHLMLL